MTWDLKSDRPIYLQIVEQLELDIVSGRYKPGEKFPSVRDLATEAAVNPNTMQKALAELEELELLFTQRTSGRFVTEDVEKILQAKNKLAKQQSELFFDNMCKLGLTHQEIENLLHTITKEKSE